MKDKTKSVLLCVLALVLGIIVSGVCMGKDPVTAEGELIKAIKAADIAVKAKTQEIKALKTEMFRLKVCEKALKDKRDRLVKKLDLYRKGEILIDL